MNKREKVIVFELRVTVPKVTGESDVENAINAALDEPPCDWGIWTVGAACITGVEEAE